MNNTTKDASKPTKPVAKRTPGAKLRAEEAALRARASSSDTDGRRPGRPKKCLTGERPDGRDDRRDERLAIDAHLAKLADIMRREHDSGTAAANDLLEHRLALGAAGNEARAVFGGNDHGFGVWFKEQGFNFTTQWLGVCRNGARHADRVREVWHQHMGATGRANFEKIVEAMVGAGERPTTTTSDGYKAAHLTSQLSRSDVAFTRKFERRAEARRPEVMAEAATAAVEQAIEIDRRIRRATVEAIVAVTVEITTEVAERVYGAANESIGV